MTDEYDLQRLHELADLQARKLAYFEPSALCQAEHLAGNICYCVLDELVELTDLGRERYAPACRKLGLDPNRAMSPGELSLLVQARWTALHRVVDSVIDAAKGDLGKDFCGILCNEIRERAGNQAGGIHR